MSARYYTAAQALAKARYNVQVASELTSEYVAEGYVTPQQMAIQIGLLDLAIRDLRVAFNGLSSFDKTTTVQLCGNCNNKYPSQSA
jgi:hypothetical protein